VNEQRAFGSDGCNTFRGSVYNEENRLYFGPLASTMMACIVNKEISIEINTILATKNLTYTIENNRLNLFDKDRKVMVLKHID
jgi:heat shock protein HslJ